VAINTGKSLEEMDEIFGDIQTLRERSIESAAETSPVKQLDGAPAKMEL